MKRNSKALLMALCAVLLVVSSVFGTLAYLTDSETVTNTMTVGKVGLSLDETDVDVYGKKDGDTRVQNNAYKLIPGREYIKDPIVHVDANSENSYIFVKIENQIEGLEDSSNTIAAQIAANGWTALAGEEDVYYKAYTKSAEIVDLPVFANFKIDGTKTSADLTAYEGKTIVVTAYAVQADGFTDANAAWDATFGA